MSYYGNRRYNPPADVYRASTLPGLNNPVAALAAQAMTPNPERKRAADAAGNKLPHNRARYLVNLMHEAAQELPARQWTAAEYLEAAWLVDRAQGQ